METKHMDTKTKRMEISCRVKGAIDQKARDANPGLNDAGEGIFPSLFPSLVAAVVAAGSAEPGVPGRFRPGRGPVAADAGSLPEQCGRTGRKRVLRLSDRHASGSFSGSFRVKLP
jgi:hypothetical protein